MNFLADSSLLVSIFHDTFQVINLERWLNHVARCPDPMCGLVVAIDGTCKVVREICGAALPVESECRSLPHVLD